MDAVGRLPGLLLRLEGAAVLAATLALYFDQGFGWLALVVLVLAPDLAMVAYSSGPRAGAIAYDGLKYPTAFGDTHLQRV